MRKRNQAKADEMRSHIEACSKSGLSVSDYCAQNGLLKSGYYYWHKKLSVDKESPSFIPVSINRNSTVEISYPNGVQISFSGEVNVATLKVMVCCI